MNKKCPLKNKKIAIQPRLWTPCVVLIGHRPRVAMMRNIIYVRARSLTPPCFLAIIYRFSGRNRGNRPCITINNLHRTFRFLGYFPRPASFHSRCKGDGSAFTVFSNFYPGFVPVLYIHLFAYTHTVRPTNKIAAFVSLKLFAIHVVDSPLPSITR